MCVTNLYKMINRREGIKVAPSKARILKLTHEQLIGHFNLVRLKRSTFSAAQRALITRRMDYLTANQKISMIDVDLQLAKLKDMVGLQNYNPN